MSNLSKNVKSFNEDESAEKTILDRINGIVIEFLLDKCSELRKIN